MSTVKISQLPNLPSIAANTSNSLFLGVDLPTGVTGKFTATTLAQQLYANNYLVVGQNYATIFPNTVGQFSGSDPQFLQVNNQNFNSTGSGDYIVTADTGTNANSYIDLGINNSQFNGGVAFSSMNPYDGYLYVHGPSDTSSSGNLIIGTASANANVLFVVGNTQAQNIVATMTKTGLVLNTQSYLTFSDGTTQSTAAASNAFTQAAYSLANTVASNLSANNTLQSNINSTQNTWISSNAAYLTSAYTFANTVNTYAYSAYAFGNTVNAYAYSAYAFANSVNTVQSGINSTQNTWISSNAAFTQAAFALANTAVQNTAIVQLQALTLTGNLIANSVGQGIFVDTFTSNNATFSKNMVVFGNLTANTLLGNIFFSNVVTTTSQSNSIIWSPQATTPTQQTGQLFYYSNTQSLILDTDIPGDRLSISKVLFFRGYNSTGATIPANSFVRLVAGVTTNNIPYLALADATSSANATVAGFVKNSIANGTYGFAYSQGIVEEFNSTALGNTGDILFLSATPGLASNVAPTGANTVVQLGRIILSDTVQGKLFVQNQLRQAYGKPNGSLLYAYANNITSSNTISINDSTGMLTAKDITANTLTTSNGIINTVRVNSTSPLTINFTTDTIVRANLSANFTVTPASFVAGKTIDVWLTNTSTGGGANHTITHGVSALNSTVGATTFTLAGTQSARLKYMCADGTLANTFVAITYQ